MDTAQIHTFKFPLANGVTVAQGDFACGLASGLVGAAAVATGLIVIGLYRKASTGDGTTKVEVALEKYVWATNSLTNPCVAADVFDVAYLESGSVVSNLATGGSPAGRILAVDPDKGVLVQIA